MVKHGSYIPDKLQSQGMSGVGRDTEEALQVWSLPEAVHVVARVSHPLIIMHHARCWASGNHLSEAVGMVKVKATFNECNDHWSNVPT